MTIIKLNTELEEIKGCSTCPFCECEDILDYGELTGESYSYCGLITTNLNEADCSDGNYGSPIDRKLDNCPIISVEYKV